MCSRILPFKESIISYTPNFDHFLSVLENQHDISYPWILENYIDLIIRKDFQNPPVFEFLDYNKIWWTCPFVHVSRIAREAFALFDDPGTAIKKLIEKEFYIFFLVDTFYVNGYITYQKEHMMHDIFIYGYEGEYVYACDYFNFMNKSTCKIKVEEIVNGYSHVLNKDDYGRGVVLFQNQNISENIVLYQYKESLEGFFDVEKKGYTMDRNLVKVKLGRFLNSPAYVNSVTPTWFDYRLGYTTGFEVFSVLRSALLNHITVMPKDIHLVCCHIRLMISRTEYLMAGEADEKWKMLQEELTESFRKATIIKNLLVKDTIKSCDANRNKICDYLDDFICHYRNVLTELYDYL